MKKDMEAAVAEAAEAKEKAGTLEADFKDLKAREERSFPDGITKWPFRVRMLQKWQI